MRRTLSALTMFALLGVYPALALDAAPATPDWQPGETAPAPAGKPAKNKAAAAKPAAKAKQGSGYSSGMPTPTSPMRSISREDIDTGTDAPSGSNFRPTLRPGGVGMNMGF